MRKIKVEISQEIYEDYCLKKFNGKKIPKKFYQIPEGWKIIKDAPFYYFHKNNFKFESILEKGEKSIATKEMLRRATRRKGNVGLSGAQYFLEHQEFLSDVSKDKYLVFPGTLLRDSKGDIRITGLHLIQGKWTLVFGWLKEEMKCGYGLFVIQK